MAHHGGFEGTLDDCSLVGGTIVDGACFGCTLDDCSFVCGKIIDDAIIVSAIISNSIMGVCWMMVHSLRA